MDTPKPFDSLDTASGKKVWLTPEIRNQSIQSITEAKSNSPSESSPNTGPVS